MDQKTPVAPDNTGTRPAAAQTLEALARLRAIFPLEARLATLSAGSRARYGEVLRRWARGEIPQADPAQQKATGELIQLDALVATPEGLGCYPFSAHDTGIHVRFDGQGPGADLGWFFARWFGWRGRGACVFAIFLGCLDGGNLL